MIDHNFLMSFGIFDLENFTRLHIPSCTKAKDEMFESAVAPAANIAV